MRSKIKVKVFLRSYTTKKGIKRYFLVVRQFGYADKSVNLGVMSKKDAEEKRDTVEYEMRNGIYHAQKSVVAISIEELCEKFFAKHAPSTYAPASITMFRKTLGAFQRHFRGKQLHEISREDIEEYLTTIRSGILSDNPNNGRYRNIHLSCIRQLWVKAVDWKYLLESPAEYIKRFKQHSKGSRSLTFAECKVVMQNATPWQQEIIKVGVWTGMRNRELLRLRFVDINWETLELTAKGKGGKERLITICPLLEEALKHLRTHYPNPKYGSNRKDDMPKYFPREAHQMDYVFCRENGEQLKSFQSLPKLFKRLGLRKVSLHSLRKTFCSLLAKENVHPRVAQALMGHESPELTMRIYTEIQNDQIREAVNRLPDIRSIPEPNLPSTLH
jgi:site-specific recombinase XerD